MYGESGNAAAYVHLFYVLSCVERYVDSLKITPTCFDHQLIIIRKLI
jgi:hypothetical protein